MNANDFADLLGRITYKPDFALDFWGRHAEDLLFRARFWRADAVSGAPGWGYGRVYVVPASATPAEVVTAAFTALLALEEHECREHFRVDGVAILAPHFDLDRMLALRREG